MMMKNSSEAMSLRFESVEVVNISNFSNDEIYEFEDINSLNKQLIYIPENSVNSNVEFRELEQVNMYIVFV